MPAKAISISVLVPVNNEQHLGGRVSEAVDAARPN
jgi:hypothetical protein